MGVHCLFLRAKSLVVAGKPATPHSANVGKEILTRSTLLASSTPWHGTEVRKATTNASRPWQATQGLDMTKYARRRLT